MARNIRPWTSGLEAAAVLVCALLLAATAARAAEHVRLRISVPGLGSSSYPLVMAQKKGYFRAEGYEVELIPMAAGLAVKTLPAGEVGATSRKY